MLAVKTKVLRECLSDLEYARRMAEAKCLQEAENIIVDFARAKGYKIVEA